MGIFINEDQYDHIYINKRKLQNSNQNMYKINFLEELLLKQVEENMLLKQTLAEIQSNMKATDEVQGNKLTSLNDNYKVLLTQFEKQKEWQKIISTELSNILQTLEKHQSHLDSAQTLQADLFKEVKESLNKQVETLNIFNERIDREDLLEERLSQLFQLQQDSFQQNIGVNKVIIEMRDKLDLQIEQQNKLEDRIEHQEILQEKNQRQLTYLRSILFERTAYITEKIEQSYKMIIDYIDKLFNRSAGKRNFFVVEKEKNNKQEKVVRK